MTQLRNTVQRKVVMSAGSTATLKKIVEEFRKHNDVKEVVYFDNKKRKNYYNEEEYIEYCAAIVYEVPVFSRMTKIKKSEN